ncbi:conserved hypothetical protein [Mesorhizobium prunaredense]|uniref:Uncharacterized protein n=2 Tax=Mesorhizobium TaxID=68287 RepID=A0A1R3VC40_9HYPH|nr:conserved hypothetical protein [Mesorhizobium prunaredense]SJM34337.1 conserved hypothetical protein [Mesorhizobium delmotii]
MRATWPVPCSLRLQFEEALRHSPETACVGTAQLESGRNAGLRHRTHRGTLLRIEDPLAFGALLRLDHVALAFELDRTGGAFEFAGAALRALGCDNLESHFASWFGWNETAQAIAASAGTPDSAA